MAVKLPLLGHILETRFISIESLSGTEFKFPSNVMVQHAKFTSTMSLAATYQDGDDRHIEFWLVQSTISSLDENTCTKFGMKIQRDHAEMTM